MIARMFGRRRRPLAHGCTRPARAARVLAVLRALLDATARATFMAVVLAGSGCALTGDRMQQLQQDGVFVYPAAARAARATGKVRVRFDITADGRVENARVMAAEPPGLFDAAALTYVQGRRYLPARRDGEAVPVAGVIARIRFDLGDVDAYPAAPQP